MKFNRSSQLVLVSALSLAAAAFLNACGTLTADFVYVTSTKAAGPSSFGEVDVFEVNQESGHMRQIPTSPFPSEGRAPVAEVASTDSSTLYVVNQDDNSIVQFVIGTDGKLYSQNTVNTPGVFPLAIATTSSFLFVADTYQPLPTCSTAAPCSGSVAVYPVLTAAQAKALTPSEPADTLGPPVANAAVSGAYWPLTMPSKPQDVVAPTSLSAVASGPYLFVTAVDQTANTGYVFGFAVNSDGTLAALPGSPFPAGLHPSALAPDPSGSYVYVTDLGKNTVLTFAVNSGALTQVAAAASGSQPMGIVLDKTGKFAYVANSQDSNVTAYSVSNGTLTALGTYTTGTQPVAIGIDPGLNQYVYTTNFLGNNVTGFQLSPTDGSLLYTQSSPFNASANPTAVAAIPHKVSN